MDETTAQTLGYLFVLAGVGGYAWLWLGSLQVFRRRTWSCVPGTVLRSQVVRRTGPDDPQTATYEARIEYEYAVGDRTLRGRTICSRGGELDAPLRQRAEQRCLRYPVGAEVDVFYDPAEPGKACLERSATGAALIKLASGVSCLVGLATITGMINWG